MHLISALAAGIKGAEEGYVKITARATAGPTSLYADYGGTQITYNTALPLDANGGVVVYVSESVDVAVTTSDNVLIRSWTEMVSDALVEVVSPSFTGHDYTGGAAGVQKPTTQEAVNDAWISSAGAPDWNALVNGVSTSIQLAFANMGGLIFNVRAYGAVGNGVHDDTISIQAALSAAVTAGGGIVWFPAGTYKITAALASGDNVALVGPTAGASTVILYDAGADILVLSSCSGTAPVVVQGLTLTAGQANTGSHIVADAVTPVIIRDCVIGGANSRGNLVSMPGTAKVYCNTTQLIAGTATNAHIFLTGSVGDLVCLTDCVVTGPANAYAPSSGMIVSDNIFVKGIIVNLNTTVGTATTIFASHNTATTPLCGSVTNCEFVMSGASVTSTVFNLGPLSATVAFHEANNGLSPALLSWASGNINASASLTLGSRHRIYAVNAIANAATTLPTDQYDTVYVTVTAAAVGAPTFVPTIAPRGCKCTIMMRNTFVGASGVYKLDIWAGVPTLLNSTSISHEDAVIWLLESVASYDDTGTYWTIVGASIVATAIEMEEFTD